MKLNIKNFFVYIMYLILIIFILNLFFNLKFSTQSMINEIENITPYIRDQNWETTKLMFNNFNENYKSTIENLSIFISNKEINEVLLCIIDIFSNIDLKNKDICLNKIEILKFHLSNFYKSQIPNYKNIF